MDTQNQIKRVLSEPTSIVYIRELLEREEVDNRTRLAELVCEQADFYDLRGQPQLSGCLKALRELEELDHFNLPPPSVPVGVKSPRRLNEPVALPVDVPAHVNEVGGLHLVLVSGTKQMRIWNELMINDHPQGAGPLVGRQLRYLIGSNHGWLGGLGFAAPALQLADRDAWIGWDHEQRCAHLHGVVGLSRFLIRPSVHCVHLASKVLSLGLRSLVIDFEQRYGYQPWLVESFVDISRYSGTSYRAANWTLVGHTRGRGRQDRDRKASLSRKAIYVYPIEADFRQRMGLSADAGRGALTPVDGLDSGHWATHEFGGAPLGDVRLSKRLVNVAAAKAEVPGRAFSGVAKGDWPAVKGYYRMIDKPDDSAVSMANILAPHRQRTVRRMMGQQTVLCLQDGTDVDYTSLEKCQGLDETVTNQTGATRRGLHFHSTYCVAPNGLPLGVLRTSSGTNRVSAVDRPKSAKEKKTWAWIDHHRDLVETAAAMPGTRLIDVCDREADFFDLFVEQRQSGRVELLVRAQHDRTLESGQKLFATVRDMDEAGMIRIPVQRQSVRPKKRKQKASVGRAARLADMTLRYRSVQLPPTDTATEKTPVQLWIVHALEETPPANQQAIEWFLLTTMAISSVAQAEQCLRWYCLRWRIEDWHRVLKSGCRIEDLQHETAERLRRAIAINMVIAWRIMLLTLLGRESPDLEAEVLFSDVELRVLRSYAKKKRLKPPDRLGDAILVIAKIGGYLGRKKDPPPGHQILWQGYQAFEFMCLAFELFDDDDGPD